MKKTVCLCCCLCFSYLFAQAQHLSVDFPFDLRLADTPQAIDYGDFTIRDFAAFSVVVEGPGLESSNVRLSYDVGQGWETVNPFGEAYVAERYVSELFFVKPEFRRLRLRLEWPLAVDKTSCRAKVHLFSPTGPLRAGLEPTPPALELACPCPKPNFVPRSNWGAAWGLNGNVYVPPAVYTTVTHLIVHHSAGANTSNNWPGVVAAIFDYHVNTNGWQDVGYNWLIDPKGVLYEGRGGGNNVRGAHMCGYNNNTMGVCLLGNFVSVAPPEPALQALTRLFAWKACDAGIDPVASGPINSHTGYMAHISGHQDGCAPNYTECPGDLLYAKLASLRTGVRDYIQNTCATPVHTGEVFAKTTAPRVFPNPIGDRFQVEWPDALSPAGTQLRLFGSTGQPIPVSVQNTSFIDAANLLPGVYWLVIQTAYENFKIKIIK